MRSPAVSPPSPGQLGRICSRGDEGAGTVVKAIEDFLLSILQTAAAACKYARGVVE